MSLTPSLPPSLSFSFLSSPLSLTPPPHTHTSDYKEYHTDTTVRFVVYLSADKMAEVEHVGYHKKLKLETNLNTSNLVMERVNVCRLIHVHMYLKCGC